MNEQEQIDYIRNQYNVSDEEATIVLEDIDALCEILFEIYCHDTNLEVTMEDLA